MSNFDYGNARLRAMKSRLLSRDVLDNLAAVGSVPALLNALTQTSYRTAVEKALIQFTDMMALQTALQQELVDGVSRVRSFFTGQAGIYTGWLLRRYDVDNVKAILRGVNHQLPVAEILKATLPIGELTRADLMALAHAEEIGGVLDLLATWRLSLGQPLLEAPSKSLSMLELALEQWYFQAAMALGKKDGHALRQMILWQTDVGNMQTVLRLVQLQQELVEAELAVPPFIGPGRIPEATLLAAAQEPTVAKAVAVLSHGSYRESLAEGLVQYSMSQRLSAFERPFRRAQQRQAHSFFINDPHGIGILVGYLLLKMTEISNLRHIAYSLQLGESPEMIRLALI